MTVEAEGHGILVKLINKVINGTRTTTVTSVAAAPLNGSLFAIPDGWKRVKK
jgi:hypothetical protein